jgi:MHS family citrate/tricarballylate:H+ symporter-like MFS transporter
MMMVVMTTVSFYLITVYTPTFGKNVLKLSTDSLIVTFCVGCPTSLAAHHGRAVGPRGPPPGAGGLHAADHADRLPGVSGWCGHQLRNMLITELWLSFLYASYNGATVVALTE